jgi:hypothetical protein
MLLLFEVTLDLKQQVFSLPNLSPTKDLFYYFSVIVTCGSFIIDTDLVNAQKKDVRDRIYDVLSTNVLSGCLICHEITISEKKKCSSLSTQ